MHSLLSFLFGADFEILQLCPTDYAKQRKRLFVAILVAIIVAISSSFLFSRDVSLIASIGTLLFYIMFLCKQSNAASSKFALTPAIAAFIFWGFSFPAFGGIRSLNPNNIEAIVIASILAIVDLVLCYMPVNFSDGSSNYDKLYKQKMENKVAQGKLLIKERANAEETIIRNREATRIRLEADVSKYMFEKILKAPKSVIDKIVKKWQMELEKEASKNFEKFCTYDKVQQIKTNKVYEEELNNYISKLLKDKREEFAQIIVEEWAKEKKQELQNNPKAYIS